MKLKYRIKSTLNEIKSYLYKVINALKNKVYFYGKLYAVKITNGHRENLGLIDVRLVSTAGKNAIVDAFQNTFALDDFHYHGSGTGTTAPDVADTTLETEVESRATGTATEGASANIFKSVGTVAYTATRAVTEHGIFSASTAGTLLDRSTFTAINVNNGDSIEFTYELTVG